MKILQEGDYGFGSEKFKVRRMQKERARMRRADEKRRDAEREEVRHRRALRQHRGQTGIKQIIRKETYDRWLKQFIEWGPSEDGERKPVIGRRIRNQVEVVR